MPIELEMTLRLLLAAVLSGIIGYQRERVGKPVGLRTHALIGLGAALFTMTGIFGFKTGDPGRIAAGLVTGIGFLGAGTILHREGGVIEGLTTAATIWLVAAIGLASGVGMYLIAAVATVVSLAVLFLPHPQSGNGK